tara:strand:- start:268 stop:1089 length:822 start_codon:yes stop_codon:yes gene_type:complete
MSSEKEIVNYWYNKRGFFTINNVKTSNNKDAGILALKFDNEGVSKIYHLGVSCSITNNVTDTTNLDQAVKDVMRIKFNNKDIKKAVEKNLKNFKINKNAVVKVIILGSVSKNKRKDIVSKFSEYGVSVIEFDEILYEVMDQLDTRYYRNDIIRSLQLMKYLLLNQPEKMSQLIASSLSHSSRKELISNMMDKDEIIKEFKMTNKDRLGSIIKSSKIKTDELVEVLDKNVLNNKNRKGFVENIMRNDKMRSILDGAIENGYVEERKEKPLNEFF